MVNAHGVPADTGGVVGVSGASAEMVLWLRDKYSRIQLAFVPARCTSFLQVADVSIIKALKVGVERKIR